MNWEAVGAIGEILGALAVVITLIFLTIQLRYNTRAVEESRKATVSQLYQFRVNMHMDGTLRRAESSGFSIIEVQAKIREEGLDSLTDQELDFARLHAVALVVRLDNGVFQYRNGFLDEDYFSYIENVIAEFYPQWVEIGAFDYGVRPGFMEEAKRMAEKRGGT